MPGGTVCQVVALNDPAVSAGDLLLGAISWQTYGVQRITAVSIGSTDAMASGASCTGYR